MVGRACQNCQAKGPIHVHHIRYKNLHDCTTDDLIVFCEDCHNILHKMIKFKNLPLEGHDIKFCCSLINEFRASPNYEIRNNRIKFKKQAQQRKQSQYIDPHQLSKREKKEINRAWQLFTSRGSKVSEIGKFIASIQAVADRRLPHKIVLPPDRPHVATLIMEYSASE